MSIFKGLSLAIEFAHVQRDRAVAQWQIALRTQANGHGQMTQLQQYASETDQRWALRAEQGTTPELLHHHRQFMERLYQAIQLQGETLGALDKKVANTRQIVLNAELRLSSFKKVLASKEMGLKQQQQRQEQKYSDEFAAQQMQRSLQQRTEETS